MGLGGRGHWRMGKSGRLPSNPGRTRNLILQTEATAKTAKTHRMKALLYLVAGFGGFVRWGRA